MRITWIAVCLSTFFLSGCSRNSVKYEFETQPRALFANSTRSPQIAVSPAGKISLLSVYQEGDNSRIGFSMSHDGGDHFMALKPLSEEAAKISAHGENNPRMAVSGRAVYALWEQSQTEGSRDLVVARSLNEGQSFEKPVRVNDNVAPSFHGFASVATGKNGEVYVAWLDGRETPESPGTFDIYLARSTDRGATFGPNRRVARSACPCCRPQVAVGTKGEVYIAWRKVFSGSIRDMALSASKDGGQSFAQEVRVAEDRWEIHGCPESGASLLAVKDRLYIAWMTGGVENHPQIRLAWSDDGGASFHVPIEAAKGIEDPNHPFLAESENGRTLLCFQGRPASGDSRQWAKSAAFVEEVREGRLDALQALGNADKTASYPTLAIGSDRNIFAVWTAAGDTNSSVVMARGRVRTAN
jgi:hypothetical protein